MPLHMYKEKPVHPLSNIKNVVAIAAGKGGVGKSTLTINLALSLKRLGCKVGIMDADVYGPSVRKMLPEDRLPVKKGEKITPALCRGISMMSIAYFRNENEAAAVRAPIANGIISQFIEAVEWGELDYLLIDFPPGTGDVQLTLSQKARVACACMVTTPQEVSLLDVKKAMHLFEQVHIPIIGIVENMSYFEQGGQKVYPFGIGGGKRLAQGSGLPLIGEIPLDPAISECGDAGTSIFDRDCSDAADCFLDIARRFHAHVESISEQYRSGVQNFELVWKETAS